MARIELELPDDLVEQLRRFSDRAPEVVAIGLRQMRVADTLDQYERGQISFGRAVELSGVPYRELVQYARAARIEPAWSEEMVKQELA